MLISIKKTVDSLQKITASVLMNTLHFTSFLLVQWLTDLLSQQKVMIPTGDTNPFWDESRRASGVKLPNQTQWFGNPRCKGAAGSNYAMTVVQMPL